jgi:hypothetical protein
MMNRDVVDAKRQLEFAIQLPGRARVELRHPDAAVSSKDLVVRWVVLTDARGPTAQPERLCVCERVLPGAEDSHAGQQTATSTRGLGNGQATIDVPADIPLRFEVFGRYASGHTYLTRALGPIVLRPGVHTLDVEPALTGSLLVDVRALAIANTGGVLQLETADGSALDVRAEHGQRWSATHAVGGLGTTLLRGLPPGRTRVRLTTAGTRAQTFELDIRAGETTTLVID